MLKTASELTPSSFPAKNFPFLRPAFSAVYLIIISSSFYSAARRGGPYFLDEKKVCKDSRGPLPLDPRGCSTSPSPLTFPSALGRLVPLGSLNAGPFTGTLAILRLRKFLRIFGVRRAGRWRVTSAPLALQGSFGNRRLSPRGIWWASTFPIVHIIFTNGREKNV